MGLELLGAGAGAGQGLEQLIAQRRAEELMRQQALTHAMSAIGLREDRQARLGQQKAQADALAASREEANRNREMTGGLQLKQSLEPGTELGQISFDKLVKSGAALPEEFNASPGTPASLPSTNLSGLTPIPSPSQAIAPSYRFKGTAQQQEKASGQASLDAKRQADIQHASDMNDQAAERASQAWQRLKIEGDTQASRAAASAAMADAARTRLELERQRNETAAAKTPKPDYMQDDKGNWHAMVFDKGALTEIPMPKGFIPTKPTVPSTWESIKRMFSGGSSDSGPTTPAAPTAPDIIPDKNWGKR